MIRRCLLRYQIEKEISQMLEDIFFISKKLDIHYVSADKWNWLHQCNLICAAPLSVVEFYIKHGVEINAQDMEWNDSLALCITK